MLIDANQIGDGDIVETEICIIGAGPAGISCAAEFLDSSTSVCLLESGGHRVEPKTQALAGGSVTGQKYFPLVSTRARVFGGTSIHWSGWCRPLDRIDFEERPWIPYSGWPLTLESLTDFYARAQQVCDVGPFRYDLADWPHGDEPVLGEHSERLATKVIQFGPPTRFGQKYRSAFEASENVRVILHSNVLNFDADPSARHVDTVSVATLSGKRFQVRAKSFVMATGGLENARLLLLSDQVQSNGLGNDHDLVGRFFMNHTFVPGGFIVGAGSGDGSSVYSRQTARGSADETGTSVQAYLTFRRSVQAREQIANVSFNLGQSDLSSLIYGSGPDHEWYEKVGLTVRNLDEVIRGAFNRTYAKFDSEKRQTVFALTNITEQTPNPTSRVTLSSEVDQLGQRRMNLDWRLNDIDLASLKRSHTILGAELARLGHGRIVTNLDDVDGWPQEYIGDWHHIGTTRMSDDASQGVVDADCKVHGIDNLFIAGSSVFPTSGYANPTLTIVALALRLADHIKSRVIA